MSPAENSSQRTVLVIGTGLIGTSIGMGLTAKGERVWLMDADPEAVEIAVERGAGKAAVLGALDLDPSVVFVAVPPLKAADVISTSLSKYVIHLIHM